MKNWRDNLKTNVVVNHFPQAKFDQLASILICRSDHEHNSDKYSDVNTKPPGSR